MWGDHRKITPESNRFSVSSRSRSVKAPVRSAPGGWVSTAGRCSATQAGVQLARSVCRGLTRAAVADPSRWSRRTTQTPRRAVGIVITRTPIGPLALVTVFASTPHSSSVARMGSTHRWPWRVPAIVCAPREAWPEDMPGRAITGNARTIRPTRAPARSHGRSRQPYLPTKGLLREKRRLDLTFRHLRRGEAERGHGWLARVPVSDL